MAGEQPDYWGYPQLEPQRAGMGAGYRPEQWPAYQWRLQYLFRCAYHWPNVTRNVAHYIIAHASKFVKPGAVRIASDQQNTLLNVAFKNTDGSKVLIVLNTNITAQTFNIKFNSKQTATTLAGGAVATYKW